MSFVLDLGGREERAERKKREKGRKKKLTSTSDFDFCLSFVSFLFFFSK